MATTAPTTGLTTQNGADRPLWTAHGWPRVKERIIESLLFLAALFSIAITAGIVGVLVYESSGFFKHVSLIEFFTDRLWTPLFADAHYGILPLVAGTLVTTGVALLVALPIGTVVSIYLSEFAPARLREIIKPVL